MGIPLIRGRLFSEDDRVHAAETQVLIISAELARRYFPDEDPIGKYIETGWGADVSTGSVVARFVSMGTDFSAGLVWSKTK